MLSKKELAKLRLQYPIGTRIELVFMDDAFSPLNCGSKGTVVSVDDIGTVHVSWDCGSSLGLVYGEDKFKVIK